MEVPSGRVNGSDGNTGDEFGGEGRLLQAQAASCPVTVTRERETNAGSPGSFNAAA
ncbi:hypothetical protein [Streptomyces sp. NPDC050164]|uniref:hypothetical protein n=1 Tax=Streptomyces sp. NPDC050164 TaxID=3365605 RepID=UPI003794B1C0